MKRYSDQFISDLSTLLRHGPQPFDQLITDLSDPDRRQSLIEALSQLSRIASEGKSNYRSKSRSSKRFSYDDIHTPQVENGDTRKADMLDSLREQLTKSPALKSRRALEDLTHQLSVPIAKKDSIPVVIQKILADLSTRDAEEVVVALNWVKEADSGSTQSFMDLASFITRNSASTEV